MKEEIWKDIPNYKGVYQVSNLGKVRSLDRVINSGRMAKGITLKADLNANGYMIVNLYMNGIRSHKRVHRLVLLSFLGPSQLSCDHLNGIRHDNRLENLEYVTARENVRRGNISDKNKKKTSIYTGVSWKKRDRKFESKIFINGKNRHLGHFVDELEAAQAYRNELKKHHIQTGETNAN